MSMKLRIALAIGGILVLVAGWFLVIFRPNQQEISELRDEIETTQEQIVALEAQLQRLQDLRDRAPELREEARVFGLALPSAPRVPDFILQVQDAADQANVEFLTITPSLPAPFEGDATVQAVGVSVTTDGSFFAVQDFVYRLERLDRAVKVNSFGLSPQGEGGLSVSLQMQMFNAPAAVSQVPANEAPADAPPTEETAEEA